VRIRFSHLILSQSDLCNSPCILAVVALSRLLLLIAESTHLLG